jgi:formamidopyrimidine-DNA glycosylase
MMELPEAVNLADQVNSTISGKVIKSVTAGYTPHKLAWYYGDRDKYSELLNGKRVGTASAYGGLVEIKAGNACILLGEGAAMRFKPADQAPPSKHQFYLEFTDCSALVATVQMYGGMGSFPEGELDNPYYKAAKARLSPFSAGFDRTYFEVLVSPPEAQKLSLKGLLATEQRIPGLGNGVLQDILFNARLHPKKKSGTMTAEDRDALFNALKSTLAAMVEKGGRDTEMDLFGRPGGYRTILSKNTVAKPCPACGSIIQKEAYMGGAIYYCPACQRM